MAPAGRPRLQLGTKSNARYLVDGSGKPFQIRGSSTWCIVQLTREEIAEIYDNTAAKKFNSVVVMSALSANANAQYGPAQTYGLSPFTDSKLTPSIPFWEHVEYMVDEAAKPRVNNPDGLLVQLASLYAGHPASQDGFASRIAGCTTGECQAFGEWLGRLFRRKPNLIWICGGDDRPETDSDKWDALYLGILSQDSGHLMSGHPSRGEEGRVFGPYITLNSIYRNIQQVASGSLAAYTDSPLTLFGFEFVYEGDGTPWSNPTITATDARPQAWQCLLSGASGYNFGNHEVWTCGYVNGSNVYPNWKTTGLDSAGHVAMTHVADFFDRIAWWTLVPDVSSTFVTAGRSSNEDYVAAAFTSSLGVAVIPGGGEITVDMSEFSAPPLCRWFDPTDGSYSTIGTFSNSGTRNFDPSPNAAGDNDMVLLLEVA